MHFDTRLFFIHFVFITKLTCNCQYSDEQSYLSLVEFNRGGSLTNIILSSPHGGFLSADLAHKKLGKTSVNALTTESLEQLPAGGCYNNTLDRCVYTLRDCLGPNNGDNIKNSYQPDARCVIDRSSTSAMHTLTKSIAAAFQPPYRPFTILNKLTRQYVDPAQDLLIGTFLVESSIRVYMDYHRLIAMAKEAIRSQSHGLFIEFIFHRDSQAIQIGYGFEPKSMSTVSRSSQSTITQFVLRSGPSVITGNKSLGYFLSRNGFQHVIPLAEKRQIKYRLSSHSTRTHADQRFNAILFSYPIERLRTHALHQEAMSIAKAIEQFNEINNIKPISGSSLLYVNSILMLLLFASQSFSNMYICH